MKIHQKHLSTRFKLFINSLVKNCILLLIPLLAIAPYSIYRSIHDNSQAFGKNISLTLEQFNSSFDELLSHADNATSFFSMNPRVTLQLKKSFREPSISLESQRNVMNLSLYFQNLLYTNEYLSNIYIYYKNDNHRIYRPSGSALYAMDADAENALLDAMENAPDQNTWFLLQEKKFSYSDTSAKTLYLLRKLYTPGAASFSGLLILEYDMDHILQELDKLMQYPGQLYYIFDSSSQPVGTNFVSIQKENGLPGIPEASEGTVPMDASNVSPKGVPLTASEISDEIAPEISLLLSSHTSDTLEEASLQRTSALSFNGQKYLWAFSSSQRTDGFQYLCLVPYSQLYQSSMNLARIYILLTCFSMLLAFCFAWLKTNQEYKYLNTILDLLSSPEHASQISLPRSMPAGNPLNYITYNLVHLFLEQDYLKIQASESASKMQLYKLQMLQYQINPHFMHNTLNNIYWESVKLTSSENSYSKMVHDLSSLMRYSLGSPDEDSTLMEEFEYTRIYLDIMKRRFPDKYEVSYRPEEAFLSFPIKRMVLQPLVENAIYHGIQPKATVGTIVIGAKKLQSHIAVYVFDNGEGMSQEKLRQLKEAMNQDLISSVNVGLKNTNFRLKYAYGDSAGIRIKSLERRYTLVYFFIPLSEDADL